MGDLIGAPAVHLNFPLLSFSLYTLQLSKSGLPLPVSLCLWSRGGLVNDGFPFAYGDCHLLVQKDDRTGTDAMDHYEPRNEGKVYF